MGGMACQFGAGHDDGLDLFFKRKMLVCAMDLFVGCSPDNVRVTLECAD